MFRWVVNIFNYFFHRKEKVKRLDHYFINYNIEGCHCSGCIGCCICKFCDKEVKELITCEDKVGFIMSVTYESYVISCDRFNDGKMMRLIRKKCSPCLTYNEFIIKNIIE